MPSDADSRLDALWLGATARLATRGIPLSRPNPSVGAILVRQGKVIARGWTPDVPYVHEIQAVYALEGNALAVVRWRERAR